jgi:hypothetical protein
MLTTIAWATSPITSGLLQYLQVDQDLFARIFGPLAGYSIEFSTIVMCPVLYAIKYEMFYIVINSSSPLFSMVLREN